MIRIMIVDMVRFRCYSGRSNYSTLLLGMSHTVHIISLLLTHTINVLAVLRMTHAVTPERQLIWVTHAGLVVRVTHAGLVVRVTQTVTSWRLTRIPVV